LKRIQEQELLAWRESSRRKPLILRGARQTGKTWLVDHVLAPTFASYVKIDLEKSRGLHAHFEADLDPHRILNLLELTGGRITPGETLLFLDEIQTCPRALALLRYFYEEIPELHVVAAGSLLEFAFAEISVPVGRVQYLTVPPMTYHEFLLARGQDVMAAHALRSPALVDPAIQLALQAELRNYLFVGGMPECVKTWVETASMTEVFAVQTELLESYRDDFARYRPRVSPDCLAAVMLNVGRSVGEQLKYVDLDDGRTGTTNRKAFDVLTMARLVRKIPSCNPPGIPLGATANPRKFKAAFLDVGLMQRLCRVPVEMEMREKNLLDMYRGKLAEQFVAQELAAYHGPDVFYWSRSARGSSAEVDFLMACRGRVFPVEVKAGKAGRLRSMHLLLSSNESIPHGLVLRDSVYQELPDQKLKFLPLYAVPALCEAADARFGTTPS